MALPPADGAADSVAPETFRSALRGFAVAFSAANPSTPHTIITIGAPPSLGRGSHGATLPM